MTQEIRRIAYYISAHGYGHAARSIPVLKRLIRDNPVDTLKRTDKLGVKKTSQSPFYFITIKTEIPMEFFRFYLGKENISTKHRGYPLIPLQVDSGCSQGNFVYIDTASSFRNLRLFVEKSQDWLAKESHWLKENNIDLIVSDAASLPLQAGHNLGLPSLLIANFTWHDIFSGFPEANANEDLIECLRQEYATATLQLLPQCHIVNNVTLHQKEIGFIALRGNDKRQALEQFLGRSFDGKTLIFIYLGAADSSCMQWDCLHEIEDCVFLTRDPLKAGFLPSNLFILDERFSYPDLVASADIVSTKAGYSTLAMAFAHGKPVISCGRDDFCEFKAVKKYLQKKRLGLIIDTQKFYACNWSENIWEAKQLMVSDKVPLKGENEVFETIKGFL